MLTKSLKVLNHAPFVTVCYALRRMPCLTWTATPAIIGSTAHAFTSGSVHLESTNVHCASNLGVEQEWLKLKGFELYVCVCSTSTCDYS
jgi:hypothetical protein